MGGRGCRLFEKLRDHADSEMEQLGMEGNMVILWNIFIILRLNVCIIGNVLCSIEKKYLNCFDSDGFWNRTTINAS